MTYEEHLDEVATLLTEIYTLKDEVAIDLVVRAQADDFFSGHDDDPALCTQARQGSTHSFGGPQDHYVHGLSPNSRTDCALRR